MKYKNKQELKRLLSKFGIFNSMKYVYRLYYYMRHKRCERAAEKRREGLIDKRYVKLKQYENIHNGERCFIVATGPSLTIDDIEKLNEEYTFGMNSIVKVFEKTKWRPTYYGIQDSNVYAKIKNDKGFNEINIKFVADYIQKEHSISKDCILYPLDLLKHMYYKPPKFETVFSDDIYSIVYDGATITYSLLQIAVYMGFKEIYLLGCDCNYTGSTRYFIDSGYNSYHYPENEVIAYKIAKKYADEHGIKIYNATRGGKLEVFERVDFDTLF